MAQMRATFQEELRELEQLLDVEAELVLRSLRGAVEALVTGDAELADEVIAFDDDIDEVYLRTHQAIELLLARQTPVAERPSPRARDPPLEPPPRAHGRPVHDDREADEALRRPSVGRRPPRGVPRDGRAGRGDDPGRARGAARPRRRARDVAHPPRRADRPLEPPRRVAPARARRPRTSNGACARSSSSRCLERIGDHAVDIGEQAAFLATGEFREFTDASHDPRPLG